MKNKRGAWWRRSTPPTRSACPDCSRPRLRGHCYACAAKPAAPQPQLALQFIHGAYE